MKPVSSIPLRTPPLRTLAAALLVAPLGSAAAQDFTQSKTAPISIEATPRSIPSGDSLVFTGRTVARDETQPVRLTITWVRSNAATPPPARVPKPEPLTAVLHPNGTFTTAWFPKREGHYRVDVVSPDGTGRDTTSVDVYDLEDWLQDLDEDLEKAMDDVTELVEQSARIIEKQPVSPPQQEFSKLIPKVRSTLAKRKQAVADARAAIDEIRRMKGGAPGAQQAFEPFVRKMKSWKRDVDELSPKVQAALAASRRENVLCNNLIVVEEGFKLASAMLNLVTEFSKILIGYAVDLDTSVATNKAPSTCTEGCKLAFTQAIKLRDWYKPAAHAAFTSAAKYKDFASNLPGLATDLAAFGSHALFDAYCERFEGPIKGSMKAEFTEQGQVWWKYSFAIEGTLSLFYRKGAGSRDAIAVAGHMVGSGTNFTVWDNALRVQGGPLTNGAIIRGVTMPPRGMPFSDFEGIVAAQLYPTAFFIPVEGELVGSKLTLRFGPARSDFKEWYTKATGRYLILSPLALVPVFTTFDLPYKNARFLVERATGGGPVTFDVKVAGKKMTAERVLNTKRGGDGAAGTYELGIKLCNGC